MPSFQTKRPVPYGPQAMVDLVADVEAYPQFLPLCDSLTVLSRSAAEPGIETIVARMGVGYGPLQESFTSRITINRKSNSIDLVTEADRESEAAIIEVIHRAFPTESLGSSSPFRGPWPAWRRRTGR